MKLFNLFINTTTWVILAGCLYQNSYAQTTACLTEPLGSSDCDVSVLSDDFENNTTLSEWLLRHQVENTPSQITELTINANGQLQFNLESSYWYLNNVAPLVFKELAGNFMVTVQLAALNENNASLPPGSQYNSAGLMVRDPQSANSAQNYVMLDLGQQGSGTGTLTRNTTNSSTPFQYQPGTFTGELRICRVGDNYQLLRRLSNETEWLLLDSYMRPDIPSVVQVGMVINAYQSPSDMNALFDFIEFATPVSTAQCNDFQNEDPVDPDPVEPLSALSISDEFTQADQLSNWTRLHQVESRPAQYTLADTNTTTAEQFTLRPTNTGWYQGQDGPLFFKTISGNFVISASINVGRAGDPESAPTSNYNAAGVMVRNPDSNLSLNEDWLLLVIGRQGGWNGSLAESTIDSSTQIFPQASSIRGEVRICRINSTYRLYRNVENDPDWTLLATFERDDMPDEVQAGITAHAWSGPADIEAQFEYARFAQVATEDDCTLPIAPYVVDDGAGDDGTGNDGTGNDNTDNLSDLNDEFAVNLDLLADNTSDWSILDAPDGRADQITMTNGWLSVIPQVFNQNAWFEDEYGPLIYKNVTGNFAVATHLRVVSRIDNNSQPNVGYNAGGFVIRDAVGTHVNDENWVMYNMGAQAGNGEYSYAREIKKTVNSTSNLFLNRQVSTEEYLLVCRLGSAFHFFYWSESENTWREERIYNQTPVDGFINTTWRNSSSVTPEIFAPAVGESNIMSFNHELMPDTVQVGVMGHAWSDSDTEALFDYVRFAPTPPQTLSDCTSPFAGLGNSE
ncbi:DUF1349 domain-containing protein [Pleionea sediminis]|uniref:DUF1349 domain-containing protein n=1 Tax=Pleionea sediminis TaxID=2569479 RepID=UPI0011854084|nr:DUF1349 domain-containing protein [Pleionea sediminis]